MIDIIIVGGGVAGMTAAIYAKRSGKSVIIIEKDLLGGQILNSPSIENFPTYSEISGSEYVKRFIEQIEYNNIDVIYDNVVSIIKTPNGFNIITDFDKYTCKAVIIATGLSHKKINELSSVTNVSYCAVCDGAFYKNKNVAIIGGGNTALQEAIYLSNVCKSVSILHRRDKFRADKSLVDKASKIENINFILNSKDIKYNILNRRIQSITVNGVSIDLDGIFIAIGNIPNSNINIYDECSNDITIKNEYGYYNVDNFNGIFIAGDCKEKELRQLITAINDGAICATNACKYIG